jgi:ArsR family transcriptional regulator, virulence genes transcriptional regulator
MVAPRNHERVKRAMKPADLEQNARQASALLKAMANERRLLILCHLADGEKSVSELEALIDLGQSALSQHLARLRRDGLVSTRRAAQTIFYSLAGREAGAVMETLYALFCEPVKAPLPPLPSRRVEA